MQLTREQEQALKILKARILANERVSVFEGYSGTGKSTTLRFLLESLDYDESEVHFCAYTGTASKLLMDAGLSASTIHRLIYEPIIIKGECVGFSRKAREELKKLKLIVVDEYSMLPQEILVDLMSYDIPLLLVGDPAQLPPIGTPNQFINAYDAILTQVQRQALDSPILWAATKVRQGEVVKEGTYGDILFVGRKHQLDSQWLRRDVQFICGTNQTRHKINLQVSGSPFPEVGDKIIFLKNDWNVGVVNGSVGYISKLGREWGMYVLSVKVDDMYLSKYKAFYQEIPKRSFKKGISLFDKAAAITGHKVIGATIREPICIIDESYCFKEYAKNWIYTVLTRSTGEKPVAWLR